MTELDDALVPVALDLITKFGKNMDFDVVTSEGTYDPATRSKTGAVVTSYPNVKAAPPEAFEERYIDGDLIIRGDLRIILAGKDALFTPTNNMKVTIDNVKYTGTVVKPLYSGELIAAWICRVRVING